MSPACRRQGHEHATPVGRQRSLWSAGGACTQMNVNRLRRIELDEARLPPRHPLRTAVAISGPGRGSAASARRADTSAPRARPHGPTAATATPSTRRSPTDQAHPPPPPQPSVRPSRQGGAHPPPLTGARRIRDYKSHERLRKSGNGPYWRRLGCVNDPVVPFIGTRRPSPEDQPAPGEGAGLLEIN